MTSYRRARIIKENDTATSRFSWIKSFLCFFMKIICFAWKIIKVLWYWTERAILVALLL